MELIIDDSAFRKANKELFAQLRNPEKVLGRAMFNAKALIQNRIQQKGENSEGGQIGEYSEKGGSFSGFSKIASKKQQKKQSGSKFSGGYKQFRQKLGRQTEFVDLTLTGDLFRGFVVELDGRGYVIGFIATEAGKAKGIEKKYGTVFQLTKEELELVEKAIIDDVKTIINDTGLS